MDALDAVELRMFLNSPNEVIEDAKKTGQGFAAAGRRRQQYRTTVENRRHAEELRFRESLKGLPEPISQPRM